MGDVLARRIADEAVYNLSIGLTNLVCLFDCQRIVLTGYVVKDNDYLLQKVSENINATRSLYYGNVPVEVRLSKLGEEAAVIGAAALPPAFCNIHLYLFGSPKNRGHVRGFQRHEMSDGVRVPVAAFVCKLGYLSISGLTSEAAEAGGHVQLAEKALQRCDAFKRGLFRTVATGYTHNVFSKLSKA